MQIFAIILNYKSFQDTITVVENLKQQQKIDLNIIIVDNDSPNESFEILSREFNNDSMVTVLQSGRNGGFSYGNNIGLKYIDKFNPQFAVVLNNDIRIDNKLLFYNLTKEFDNYPNLYVCSPIMKDDKGRSFMGFRIPSIWVSIIIAEHFCNKHLKRFINWYRFPLDDKNEKVDCLYGSFLFFDYDKFKQLGFFDEGVFLYTEEEIIGYKIRQAGGLSLLCKKYNYLHFRSKTINSSTSEIERIKLNSTSRSYFHKTYTKSPRLLISILKCMYKFRIFEEQCINGKS